MVTFLSYEKALKKIEALQSYIDLVESFDISNQEDWIVKNYALTNSIAGVIKNSQTDSSYFSKDITRDKIILVLNSKTNNELHKVVKAGYKAKIRKKKF